MPVRVVGDEAVEVDGAAGAVGDLDRLAAAPEVVSEAPTVTLLLPPSTSRPRAVAVIGAAVDGEGASAADVGER